MGGSRWLFGGALVLLAACGGGDDGGTEEGALLVAEGEAASEAPVPAGAAERAVAGTYSLARADGDTLPAAIDVRPGCRLLLAEGALTLAEGRFMFVGQTRQRCGGGAAGEVTVHEARGRYTVDGDAIRLSAARGDAFGAAAGTASAGRVQITRLDTEGGSQGVRWIFHRLGPGAPTPAGSDAASTADTTASTDTTARTRSDAP